MAVYPELNTRYVTNSADLQAAIDAAVAAGATEGTPAGDVATYATILFAPWMPDRAAGKASIVVTTNLHTETVNETDQWTSFPQPAATVVTDIMSYTLGTAETQADLGLTVTAIDDYAIKLELDTATSCTITTNYPEYIFITNIGDRVSPPADLADPELAAIAEAKSAVVASIGVRPEYESADAVDVIFNADVSADAMRKLNFRASKYGVSVSNRSFTYDGFYTTVTGHLTIQGRTRFTVRGDASNLRVAFGNWGHLGAISTNAIRVSAAMQRINYYDVLYSQQQGNGGVYTHRGLFFNGCPTLNDDGRTAIINPGAVVVTEPFGFGMDFADGEQVDILWEVSVANVGDKIPFIAACPGKDVVRWDENSPATTMFTWKNTGEFGNYNTRNVIPVDGGNMAKPYGPLCLLGIPNDAKSSIIAIGDSNMENNIQADPDTGSAYFSPFPASQRFLMCAHNGAMIDHAAGLSASELAVEAYERFFVGHTHAIVALGTNNIYSYASNNRYTARMMKTSLQYVWDKLNGMGIKVVAFTIPPYGNTGTTGFATYNAIRQEVNKFIRSKPSPLWGIVDVASVVEQGGASAPTGEWINGMCETGYWLHYTTAAVAAIAPIIQAALPLFE